MNATTAIGVFLAAHVVPVFVLFAVYLLLCVFSYASLDEATVQMWAKSFTVLDFLGTLLLFATTLAASLLINRERLTDVSRAGAAWVAGKKSAIFFCFALGLLLQSCFVLADRKLDLGASDGITRHISPLLRVIWLLTVVIIGPLAEEMLFRGILYGGFYKSFGQIPAVILTTLLFLCVHSQVYKSLRGLVSLLTFSVALLWCRIRFKAVGPAVALHVAFNATVAVLVFFPSIVDHTSPEVHNRRGQAYGRKAQFDKAIFEFDRAIELNPTNGKAYAFRGLTFLLEGATDKALADLNRGILLEPTNALAFDSRGQVYAKSGQFEKAISDLTRAVQLDPRRSVAFLHRAYVYEQTGDYPRAIADLNKSIERDPDESIAYNELAWLFATCIDPTVRDGNAAVKLARKACDLSGWKANCVDTLAAAFAEDGDYKEAVRYEEQAIGLSDPRGTNQLEMQKRLVLYRQNQPYRKVRANLNDRQ